MRPPAKNLRAPSFEVRGGEVSSGVTSTPCFVFHSLANFEKKAERSAVVALLRRMGDDA